MATEQRFAGLSHHELWHLAHGGDPAAATTSHADLAKAGQVLEEIARTLRAPLAELETGWRGQAADAARAGISRHAQWAEAAAAQLRIAADQVGRHAASARTVIAEMPPPIAPPGPGAPDWAQAEEARANARQRALELLERHAAECAATRPTGMLPTPPPVAASGAPAVRGEWVRAVGLRPVSPARSTGTRPAAEPSPPAGAGPAAGSGRMAARGPAPGSGGQARTGLNRLATRPTVPSPARPTPAGARPAPAVAATSNSAGRLAAPGPLDSAPVPRLQPGAGPAIRTPAGRPPASPMAASMMDQVGGDPPPGRPDQGQRRSRHADASTAASTGAAGPSALGEPSGPTAPGSRGGPDGGAQQGSARGGAEPTPPDHHSRDGVDAMVLPPLAAASPADIECPRRRLEYLLDERDVFIEEGWVVPPVIGR